MTLKPAVASLIPTFNPHLHKHVGIEQEFFLTCGGSPVPKSGAFLQAIHDLAHAPWAERMVEAWTYEFSACQVEVRTSPHADLKTIREDLHACDEQGVQAARLIGTDLSRLEVASANMPMDHYRCERYDRLAAIIPPEVRLAAFRVAGTHFHLGLSCLEEAVEVHDALCTHLPELIAMSDHSHGERLRLYHQVVSSSMPATLIPPINTSPAYGSIEGWLEYLRIANVTELKSCWDLVRITRLGTVELRVLGIGENVEEILSWVKRVHTLLCRTIG